MKKALVSAAALACALPSFFGVANVSAEEKVTLDFAAIETAYGTKLWPEIIEAYKQVNPNVDIKLTMEKELEDAITPRLQSGDYPDVVLLAQSRKKALPETLIKDKALTVLSSPGTFISKTSVKSAKALSLIKVSGKAFLRL